MTHLVQNPHENWLVFFERYKQLKVLQNNRKQRKFFFYILALQQMMIKLASLSKSCLTSMKMHFPEKSVKCWREDKPWMKYCKIETHD